MLKAVMSITASREIYLTPEKHQMYSTSKEWVPLTQGEGADD
jgi:hypothetical protein